MTSRTFQHAPRQRGLSLVELMVAVAIGSFIIMVVAALFSNISRSYRSADETGRASENGAFALKAMADDLRMAGFVGFFNDAARIEIARSDLVSSTSTANCGSSTWPFQFTNASNMVTFVEFAPNLTSSNPFTCLSSSNFSANSPALVVRRASGVSVLDRNGNGSLAEDFSNTDTQIYVQSSHDGAIVFMGKDYANNIRGAGRHRQVSRRTVTAGVTTVALADAPAFEYQAHLYYIRPCSRPTGSGGVCQSTDDGGTPVPTLVRRQLGNSDPATMVEVAVAEGVETFTLQVGLDANADGVPDSYANATATNISTALTARVSLLIRSRKPQADYDDRAYTYDLGGGTTYNCAATTCAPFRRFVVTDVVQMKNYAYAAAR